MKRLQLVFLCSLAGFIGAGAQHYMSSGVLAANGSLRCNGRKFYLSKQTFQGNQALHACAAGYHMASWWEIYDASAVEYDTTLWQTTDDSGSGPPTGYYDLCAASRT